MIQTKSAASVLLCLLAFVVMMGAQSNPSGSHPKVTNLNTLIPELMRMGDVPGLSIAVIRDARVVWSKDFGVANASTKQPVSDTTVFEAASLSKPVFAYAVMRLVEKGKLDLDIPLDKYLPKPYVEDDPRAGRITARIVLSHTTGFPNWRGRDALKTHFTPGREVQLFRRGLRLFTACRGASDRRTAGDGNAARGFCAARYDEFQLCLAGQV
jgi:CubicO group peptidase (beta-lactamase class C family)